KINPFKSMISNPLQGYRRSWYLSIKPLYSLIMLLGIGICLAAGLWQYQKSQFYLAPPAQSVQMEGRYLNEFTHFLDNQTLHGRAGYAVITPFVHGAGIYLVNRGFVSYLSRDQLPPVVPVTQAVSLLGVVLSNKIPMLLNDRLADPISQRVQYIDNKYFSALTGQPVLRDIFHLQEGAGLQALMPQKAPYLNHHRHQGYALQWLLLAVAGLIILLVASITTDAVKIDSPSGEKS
ncbi:MAG: SURF1 family protein, partial [Bermanella sp.]